MAYKSKRPIDFTLPLSEQSLIDYNSPDREWGGGKPESYLSGDGTYFHGALEKGSDGVLRLEVWHTKVDGTVISKWIGSGILGQGGLVLQGNGTLTAVGYLATGDNATRRVIEVPEWIPHKTASGALSERYQKALERLCTFLGI